MPTYTFVCDDCGTEVKLEMTVSEYDEKKGSVVCKKCGKVMRRKFVSIGFVDYTGDFYSTKARFEK